MGCHAFQITSEGLVLACIERIREVQPVLNAVVDERFRRSLDDARRVDRILSSLGPVPPLQVLEEVARETPLLGVPFSVCDGIKVKGNGRRVVNFFF